MGFRVRRSVRLMPGVRVNLSKSGTSISVGGRGFTTNYSKRGTRTTVGVPGSGLSYSTFSPSRKKSKNISSAKNSSNSVWGWAVMIVIGIIIFGG